MAYMVERNDGYAIYHVDGDRYEPGMDKRCPVCGEDIGGCCGIDFMDGLIQMFGGCPNCGTGLVLNYRLDNIVADKE